MSDGDHTPSDVEINLLEGNRVVPKRVVDDRYKDIFFLFLFGVNIVSIVFIACSYGVSALRGGGPDTVVVKSNGKEVTSSHDYDTIKVIGGIFVILTFAGTMSASWIIFLSKYAASVISAVLMCIIMGTFLSGVAMIGLGYIPVGACLLVMGVLIIIGSLFFRPRIDFAAANLKVACEAIVTLPSNLKYALWVLAAQIAFIIVWTVAASGYTTNNYSVSQTFNGILYNIDECTTYKYSASFDAIGQTFTCSSAKTCYTCICGNTWVSNKPCFTSKFYVPAFFLLLLSLFWTSAVCANIVHCTTAASVATWWSTEPPIENDQEITSTSFHRACSTSLGSICFGSLLVAVVRTTRSFVMLVCKRLRTLNSDDYMSTSTRIQLYTLSVLEYFLSVLDRLLVYFNRYAFCYVAIHGLDFMTASKQAMDLFVSRGWTALLNDDIIDLILNLGNILIGVMTMCVAHYYCRLVGLNRGFGSVLSFLGLFGGYLLSMVVMSTISSAVATVYVCLADSPDDFRDCHPDEYYVLSSIWAKIFPTPGAGGTKQTSNRRIVTGPLEEDKTVSPDESSSKTPESRTVRGSYRPPRPSEDPTSKGGFGGFFSKKKAESRAHGGSFGIQMTGADNAGYGGSSGGSAHQHAIYGSDSGVVQSSSEGAGGGEFTLSESQREALKVPLDLYHAASNLFGSAFQGVGGRNTNAGYRSVATEGATDSDDIEGSLGL